MWPLPILQAKLLQEHEPEDVGGGEFSDPLTGICTLKTAIKPQLQVLLVAHVHRGEVTRYFLRLC